MPRYGQDVRNKQWLIFFLLQGGTVFFEDLYRAIVYRCIFQMDDTAVGARFEMPFDELAFLIIMCSKIIAHRLLIHIQFLSDAGDAALRQGVFEATKLFKSNVHNPVILVNNRKMEEKTLYFLDLPKVARLFKNKQIFSGQNFQIVPFGRNAAGQKDNGKITPDAACPFAGKRQIKMT